MHRLALAFTFFFLTTSLVLAQELGRFCFNSQSSYQAARGEFAQFKITGEEILDNENNCLDIVTPKPTRLDFWDSFLSTRHGAIYKKNKPADPCRITMEKKSRGHDNKQQFGTTKLHWSDSQSTSSGSEISTINVEEGSEATLRVDNTHLKFICRKQGDSIDVEFIYEKNKQFDTYISINNSFVFYERVTQPSEKVSSSVSLVPGQKCEIASFRKNNDNGLNHIGTDKIEIDKSKLIQTDIIYLSAE
ncbi:MAG: hypothetical protein JNM93_08385 [Bacteriovoracaceae bacterium]|nr:hypothetical protein [Bacteriovoracaceae bacterium]